MIRETSLEAYKKFVEDGGLAEAKRLVYEYIYNNGPTTQKKTQIALNDVTNSTRPRFAELERMGLIKECGTIVSKDTNNRNILYDVTNLTEPLIVEKQPTYRQKKEGVLKFIASVGKEIDEVWKNDLREIYVQVRDLK